MTLMSAGDRENDAFADTVAAPGQIAAKQGLKVALDRTIVHERRPWRTGRVELHVDEVEHGLAATLGAAPAD